MDDIFIERIVHRKKDGIHYLKVAMIIVTAILLAFVSAVIASSISVLSFLVPLLVAGCGYGAWWLISSMDLEFEYIVTNGEIDIDSIVHRRKRKRIFSGRSKDFEIMAKLDSDEWKDVSRTLQGDKKRGSLRIVDCSAVPGSPTSWFFIANHKTGRMLVVFDPDERILTNLKRFNPSRVKYNPTLHG